MDWILAAVAVVWISSLVVIVIVHQRSIERIMTRVLASDRVFDIEKEPGHAPVSHVEEQDDLSEFESEQKMYDKMEARHMSKAAKF